MTKVIISNAFSINMLSKQNQNISFKPIEVDEVQGLLANNTYESSVGHADTAGLFSNMLGVEITPNRRNDSLNNEVVLIVGQYTGPRLPEGAVNLPEGAEINWWKVEIL